MLPLPPTTPSMTKPTPSGAGPSVMPTMRHLSTTASKKLLTPLLRTMRPLVEWTVGWSRCHTRPLRTLRCFKHHILITHIRLFVRLFFVRFVTRFFCLFVRFHIFVLRVYKIAMITPHIQKVEAYVAMEMHNTFTEERVPRESKQHD